MALGNSERRVMGQFWQVWRRVLVVVVCCAGGSVRAEAPPAGPTVVEMIGTPGQIGREYGAKLAQEIRLLDEKYFGAYLPDAKVRVEALFLASAFRARMLPEHRAEVDALADTVGIKRAEMSLFQCFLDLSDMSACSTIALSAE